METPTAGTSSKKACTPPRPPRSDGSSPEPDSSAPEPRNRPKSSYVRFEADLPNGCWQADITHWFLADATRVEILDFLGSRSRYTTEPPSPVSGHR
ncbi:hypothetical protein GCM10022377_00260 [Zhihengliuella alba]|uniref:Uncharacterized protein n=1 Tax=Zhihengliuella alba TaxID=547018 RepID=A0ABP7CPQ3_9MICC